MFILPKKSPVPPYFASFYSDSMEFSLLIYILLLLFNIEMFYDYLSINLPGINSWNYFYIFTLS
jgi:hypothetical protein